MINLKLKDGSIREIEENSIYKQGDDFIDLCRDPHLLSTKGIKGFKLTSIAVAYWRGDEKNKMLQRVYGVAFANKDILNVSNRTIHSIMFALWGKSCRFYY